MMQSPATVMSCSSCRPFVPIVPRPSAGEGAGRAPPTLFGRGGLTLSPQKAKQLKEPTSRADVSTRLQQQGWVLESTSTTEPLGARPQTPGLSQHAESVFAAAQATVEKESQIQALQAHIQILKAQLQEERAARQSLEEELARRHSNSAPHAESSQNEPSSLSESAQSTAVDDDGALLTPCEDRRTSLEGEHSAPAVAHDEDCTLPAISLAEEFELQMDALRKALSPCEDEGFEASVDKASQVFRTMQAKEAAQALLGKGYRSDEESHPLQSLQQDRDVLVPLAKRSSSINLVRSLHRRPMPISGYLLESGHPAPENCQSQCEKSADELLSVEDHALSSISMAEEVATFELGMDALCRGLSECEKEGFEASVDMARQVFRTMQAKQAAQALIGKDCQSDEYSQPLQSLQHDRDVLVPLARGKINFVRPLRRRPMPVSGRS